MGARIFGIMGRQTAPVVAALLVVLVCAAPVICFVGQASSGGVINSWRAGIESGGAASLSRTMKLVVVVGCIGTTFGWLVGAPLASRQGKGKVLALSMLAAMLICPPFLWAVGVQGWKGLVPFAWQGWFDGYSGHVIASSLVVGSMVALACASGMTWLTRSTMESTLVARGPLHLQRMLYRESLQLAIGVGMLGSLMVAGEAGTGQMMGWQGVAGVIHSAFVTEHDFQKAAARTLLLVVCIAPLGLISALLVTRQVVTRSMPVNSMVGRPNPGIRVPLALVALLPLAIGLTGLIRPLWTGNLYPVFRDAWITLTESAVATIELVVLTTLIVGGIALLLGSIVARRRWLWRVVLTMGLLLIALPQSVYGLGWIMMKSQLPLQVSLPGACEPALVLAARWSLAASHFAALAWRSVPSSAIESARLNGLSWSRWSALLARPILLERVLPVAFLVALMCLGDASAVVMVQRPGWATYATRLFSIMDNSPEKQVAALCLVYIALPFCIAALWAVLRSIIPINLRRQS